MSKTKAGLTEEEIQWGRDVIASSRLCTCHLQVQWKPDLQDRLKTRVLWWDYSTAHGLADGQLRCDICNKPDRDTRNLRQIFPGVERQKHSRGRCRQCFRDACALEKVRVVGEQGMRKLICHGCYAVMEVR